jgi:cyclic beta-1,2-glucan synthetase
MAQALYKASRPDEAFAVIEALNPAKRAAMPELSGKYKLEPYYMAADIYTNPEVAGHGGWSIYTGAAGWYFRAIVEQLFGFKTRGDHAEIKPAPPSRWDGARLTVSTGGAVTDIEIERGEKPQTLVDGSPSTRIPLDGGSHAVKVVLPRLESL